MLLDIRTLTSINVIFISIALNVHGYVYNFVSQKWKKKKYEIVVGSRVLWMLCSNGLLKSLFRIFKAMINNFVPSDK